MIQEEMLFKNISYLELWQPVWSVEQNHLCNFGRRHHEEQFCEIILNLGQWFRRRCCLKIFFIWSSGSLFVQRSRSICANLVEGIKRNNSVKLFWIWNICSRGQKTFLICSSGSPFVQRSRTICAVLLEGIMRNNSVKLFWIWVSGSGGDVV